MKDEWAGEGGKKSVRLEGAEGGGGRRAGPSNEERLEEGLKSNEERRNESIVRSISSSSICRAEVLRGGEGEAESDE